MLKIEDDGEFFAPTDAHGGGRGLANIQARASLIDGRVSWASRAGGGTIFTFNKGKDAEKALVP